jgi:hypothetical protein
VSYGTSITLATPFADTVTLTGRPELKPVAGEVTPRLASALTSLTA